MKYKLQLKKTSMPIGRWNVMTKKYKKRDDQMIKENFNDYKLSSELLKAISMLKKNTYRSRYTWSL